MSCVDPDEIIAANIIKGRTHTQRALKRAGVEMTLSALKMRCDALRAAGVLITAAARPWTEEEDTILDQSRDPREALAALVEQGFERTFKAVGQRMRNRKGLK